MYAMPRTLHSTPGWTSAGSQVPDLPACQPAQVGGMQFGNSPTVARGQAESTLETYDIEMQLDFKFVSPHLFVSAERSGLYPLRRFDLKITHLYRAPLIYSTNKCTPNKLYEAPPRPPAASRALAASTLIAGSCRPRADGQPMYLISAR